MKIIRILILLAMTSLLPTFPTPAVAQQEIDPEHFDQAQPAKTAQAAKQPKASAKSVASKTQQKSFDKAAEASRTSIHPRQVKAASQQIAAVHPTGE